MYKIIKTISFAIRYVIGYYTVATIPIFKLPVVQFLYGGIIFTVLSTISYIIVAIMDSNTHKFNEIGTSSSYSRCFKYFIVYISLDLLSWLLLAILTYLKVLPISL